MGIVDLSPGRARPGAEDTRLAGAKKDIKQQRVSFNDETKLPPMSFRTPGKLGGSFSSPSSSMNNGSLYPAAAYSGTVPWRGSDSTLKLGVESNARYGQASVSSSSFGLHGALDKVDSPRYKGTKSLSPGSRPPFVSAVPTGSVITSPGAGSPAGQQSSPGRQRPVGASLMSLQPDAASLALLQPTVARLSHQYGLATSPSRGQPLLTSPPLQQQQQLSSQQQAGSSPKTGALAVGGSSMLMSSAGMSAQQQPLEYSIKSISFGPAVGGGVAATAAPQGASSQGLSTSTAARGATQSPPPMRHPSPGGGASSYHRASNGSSVGQAAPGGGGGMTTTVLRPTPPSIARKHSPGGSSLHSHLSMLANQPPGAAASAGSSTYFTSRLHTMWQAADVSLASDFGLWYETPGGGSMGGGAGGATRQRPTGPAAPGIKAPSASMPSERRKPGYLMASGGRGVLALSSPSLLSPAQGLPPIIGAPRPADQQQGQARQQQRNSGRAAGGGVAAGSSGAAPTVQVSAEIVAPGSGHEQGRGGAARLSGGRGGGAAHSRAVLAADAPPLGPGPSMTQWTTQHGETVAAAVAAKAAPHPHQRQQEPATLVKTSAAPAPLPVDNSSVPPATTSLASQLESVVDNMRDELHVSEQQQQQQQGARQHHAAAPSPPPEAAASKPPHAPQQQQHHHVTFSIPTTTTTTTTTSAKQDADAPLAAPVDAPPPRMPSSPELKSSRVSDTGGAARAAQAPSPAADATATISAARVSTPAAAAERLLPHAAAAEAHEAPATATTKESDEAQAASAQGATAAAAPEVAATAASSERMSVAEAVPAADAGEQPRQSRPATPFAAEAPPEQQEQQPSANEQVTSQPAEEATAAADEAAHAHPSDRSRKGTPAAATPAVTPPASAAPQPGSSSSGSGSAEHQLQDDKQAHAAAAAAPPSGEALQLSASEAAAEAAAVAAAERRSSAASGTSTHAATSDGTALQAVRSNKRVTFSESGASPVASAAPLPASPKPHARAPRHSGATGSAATTATATEDETDECGESPPVSSSAGPASASASHGADSAASTRLDVDDDDDDDGSSAYGMPPPPGAGGGEDGVMDEEEAGEGQLDDYIDESGCRVLGQLYEVMHVVGEGAYGMVMKCRVRGGPADHVVAIKEFKIDDSDPDAEEVRRTARREAHLLKELQHPNVVRYVEDFTVGDRLFIVMEFVPCNLLELLESHNGGMEKEAIRLIMFQIVFAISHVHGAGVVYRDIKPENLLVDELGHVKLCDFGFARYVTAPGEPLTDYVATRWYRSPELLLGPPWRADDGSLVQSYYGPPIDMWAVGCLMGELADGKPLFAGDSDIDQLYQVTQMLGNLIPEHQAAYDVNPHNAGIPCHVAEPVTLAKRYAGILDDVELDFMAGLLHMDPDQRLTGPQCLQHPYLWDLAQAAAAGSLFAGPVSLVGPGPGAPPDDMELSSFDDGGEAVEPAAPARRVAST